jgi:transcriptional regulator with XRE-family HTH domain
LPCWPFFLLALAAAESCYGYLPAESAERIGVDAGTLARWERGEREPAGAFLSSASASFQGSVISLNGDGDASGAQVSALRLPVKLVREKAPMLS